MALILGCCLGAVATTGCRFHRTDHGFVLRNDWAFEYDRDSWPRFRVAKQPDPNQNTSDGQSPASDKSRLAQGKPELLPWRSRLKGYRLGSRIFSGKTSAESSENAAVANEDPPETLPPAPPLAAGKVASGL